MTESAPRSSRRKLLAAAGATLGAAGAAALVTSRAHAQPPVQLPQAIAGGYPYWVGPPGSGAPYVIDNNAGAQVAINQALTDAGRGQVFVAGGRHPIRGTIQVGTGQTLAGAGPHGTFLHAAATVNGPMVTNRNPNDTRIVIRDIGLECENRFTWGVRLLQGSAPSEWGPDPNHLMHRVYVYRPAEDGFYLGTSGYGGGSREGKLNDCRVDGAGSIAYRIQQASDCTIVACVSQGSQIGFLVAGGNTKLSACKAFFTTGPGFRVTSGRVTLSGCESQDAQGGCGFELMNFTSGNVSGCTADSNGNGQSDRNSAGFYLENVSRLRLTGASFQRSDGHGAQRWAVMFGSNVSGVLVSLVTDSSQGSPFQGAVLGSPAATPASQVNVVG